MKNALKHLYSFVLLLILGGSAVFCTQQQAGQLGTQFPGGTLEPDSLINILYAQRVSHFETLPINSDDIVFLGNSLTSRCEWNEILQVSNIKNRGISGDTTTGILDRLDMIVKGRPRKIFLMIGINDLASGVSAEVILENIDAIVSRIKYMSPETEIYLQSMLPAGRKFNPYIAPYIPVVNVGIESIAEANDNVTYIDLYPHFADLDGYLWPELTNDDLHLLGNGYLVWASIIGPYVDDNFDASRFMTPEVSRYL